MDKNTTPNEEFVLGTMNDLDELETVYNELLEHLQDGTNYPGWIKGIYPTRETAEAGIMEKTLFILKIDNKIAASVILNHKQEEAYSQITWGIEASYDEILVIHTLVVHPDFMKLGIGYKLMNFTKTHAIEHGVKTIRLDVSIHNTPAISLYEKSNYEYRGTVDMGLGYEHLIWFKLYELVLCHFN